MGIVYKIIDNITDEIVYIGTTNQYFCLRKQQHFTPTPVKTKISSYMRSFEDWQERFSMHIIKDCDSNLERYTLEKKLVKEYKPVGNIHYIKN